MNGSFYVFVVAIAALVLFRRTRNMYRPINGSGLRIIWPVLFLIPGVMMMMNPNVHAEVWKWLVAAAIGVTLSIPLIWTTGYEVREDGNIYAKKNVGFIIAFIGVLAVRFLLRSELSMLEPQTMAALFMMMAVCYIVPWRIMSFLKFRRIYNESRAGQIPA